MSCPKAQCCVFGEVKWVSWSLPVMSGILKGMKNVLVRSCLVALVCAETYNIHLYMGKARTSQSFFTPKRATLDTELCCHGLSQTSRPLAMAHKYVKCANGANCWPGHPLIRRLPEVQPFMLRSHPWSGKIWLQNGKQQLSCKLHCIWWWQ